MLPLFLFLLQERLQSNPKSNVPLTYPFGGVSPFLIYFNFLPLLYTSVSCVEETCFPPFCILYPLGVIEL